MAKTIKITRTTLTGLPRSAQRRERGMNAVTIAAVAATGGASEGDGDGHKHSNLADLNRLGIDGKTIKVDNAGARVEYADQSDYATELDDDSPTRADFISAKDDDVAEGEITFSKGFKVGPEGYVDSTSNAHFVSVDAQGHSGDLYDLGTFIAGISGGRFWINAQKQTHLECDIVTVRDRLQAREIEVQEVTHVGGAQLISPAGARCAEVKEDGANYALFFEAEEGGVRYGNQFRPGDLIFCQVFDAGNGGTRRWWRRCLSVGDDDGGGRNYVVVSGTDCEAGSDVPQAGDAVVCLGSVTDADRQHAIALASYGSGAPLIVQLTGINSYNIGADNICTLISPQGNIFRGSFVATTGKNIEDIIKDSSDAIKLLVEGAGINLTKQTITLDADHLYFRRSDGTLVGMFEDGKFKTEFIDAANLIARRLIAGDENGQRVEIDPDTKTVTIADASGDARTILSGDIYYTVAAVFGQGTSGSITFDPASHTGKDSKPNLTNPADCSEVGSLSLGDFQTDGPTTITFSGGLVNVNVQALHDLTPTTGSGTSTATFPANIHASITAEVSLVEYTDATRGTKRRSISLGKTSAASTSAVDHQTVIDMGVINVEGKRVRLNAGGYYSIVVTYSMAYCGNGSQATVSANEFAATYVNDLSTSFYYANGWTVGSNANNYASVYSDDQGRINVEAETNGYGIKVTPVGIYTKHHGGAWLPMEHKLFHGYIVPNTAGVQMYGVQSFGGTPTAERIGVGEYILRFPPEWIALGLSNCDLRVCIAPLRTGLSFGSCYMDPTPTNLRIYAAVNGVAADCNFLLTLTI